MKGLLGFLRVGDLKPSFNTGRFGTQRVLGAVMGILYQIIIVLIYEPGNPTFYCIGT